MQAGGRGKSWLEVAGDCGSCWQALAAGMAVEVKKKKKKKKGHQAGREEIIIVIRQEVMLPCPEMAPPGNSGCWQREKRNQATQHTQKEKKKKKKKK
ncbi:hypothetical protein ACSOV8_08975 [Bacillus halotolerans]|uniref:hypothetical protein n=1 Tax=Bacillus halotolerans TaxID=260554 RepID=UPI00403EF994